MDRPSLRWICEAVQTLEKKMNLQERFALMDLCSKLAQTAELLLRHRNLSNNKAMGLSIQLGSGKSGWGRTACRIQFWGFCKREEGQNSHHPLQNSFLSRRPRNAVAVTVQNASKKNSICSRQNGSWLCAWHVHREGRAHKERTAWNSLALDDQHCNKSCCQSTRWSYHEPAGPKPFLTALWNDTASTLLQVSCQMPHALAQIAPHASAIRLLWYMCPTFLLLREWPWKVAKMDLCIIGRLNVTIAEVPWAGQEQNHPQDTTPTTGTWQSSLWTAAERRQAGM